MPGWRCRLTAATQRARHCLITPQRPVNTALARSLTATPTPIVKRRAPCLLTSVPAVPGPTAHPPTTSAGLPASGSLSPPAAPGHQTPAVKHPDLHRQADHRPGHAPRRADGRLSRRRHGAGPTQRSALRPPGRWRPVPWGQRPRPPGPLRAVAAPGWRRWASPGGDVSCRPPRPLAAARRVRLRSRSGSPR
jgi:hypothetical protein